MQSSIKVRGNYNEQEMFGHVEAWQSSRQTGVAYSRENKIAKSVLYYWLKKYRLAHSGNKSRFVPIEVHSSASLRPSDVCPVMEILLPGGGCVKCYHPVEASFIRSILY